MHPPRLHLPASTLLAAIYVVFALTLSGIPGWSHLISLVVALLLALAVADAARGRLVVAKWVWAPTSFLVVCALWSILNWERSVIPLSSTGIAWIGALVIAIRVQNGLQVQSVLRAIIVASAINAVAVLIGFDAYLLYSADFSEISEEVFARRASGLIGNSNALAIQAILPLFALALWKEGIGRVTWTVGIVCAVYVLEVSGSRKGLYLALLAVPFIACALPSGRFRNTLLTAGVLAAAIFGVVLSGNSINALPPSLADLEVLRRVELAIAGVDTSVLHRRELVDSGIKAFLGSPLYGYGLDTFRWVAGGGYYAHNNLVELAVNGGLVMTASYYYLYVLSAVRANRAHNLRGYNRILHWVLLVVMLSLEFGFVSYRDRFFVLLLLLLVVVPPSTQLKRIEQQGSRSSMRHRDYSHVEES